MLKIIVGQSLSYKGKTEHKGRKTGENEANHLSTGACTHIKHGQKNKNLFCFKDCDTSMVLDQRDSEQGENKLYVKLGYLIIE